MNMDSCPAVVDFYDALLHYTTPDCCMESQNPGPWRDHPWIVVEQICGICSKREHIFKHEAVSHYVCSPCKEATGGASGVDSPNTPDKPETKGVMMSIKKTKKVPLRMATRQMTRDFGKSNKPSN